MKKSLFIIPLLCISLSCNYLNLINKTNTIIPQKKIPIKWWYN
jgi:hypothetical protein